MNRIIIILFFLLLTTNQSKAEENIMILKLKDGDVKIELFPDVAPNHVKESKNWLTQENMIMLYFIE